MDNNSDLSQQAQDHQSSSQINAQTILSDNNIRSFNRQLFIGDLPYAVQDVHIWNLFSAYGRIERIDLKRNKKDYFCTLRGYGFVTMETHEQAALALANLDKKPFFGRVIKVAWGHSGERQGSQAVGGGGGESLDSSTFATDNSNKSNDCGNGSYLETTNNRVDSNSCSETTKSSSQLELTMGSSLAETHVHYKNINSVYVKFSCFDFNISINEMSLTEVFSRFGEVIDVSIKNISIYGHALTGFAFIHFADSLEGRDAARNCAKALANKIEDGVLYKCQLSNNFKNSCPLEEKSDIDGEASDVTELQHESVSGKHGDSSTLNISKNQLKKNSLISKKHNRKNRSGKHSYGDNLESKPSFRYEGHDTLSSEINPAQVGSPFIDQHKKWSDISHNSNNMPNMRSANNHVFVAYTPQPGLDSRLGGGLRDGSNFDPHSHIHSLAPVTAMPQATYFYQPSHFNQSYYTMPHHIHHPGAAQLHGFPPHQQFNSEVRPITYMPYYGAPQHPYWGTHDNNIKNISKQQLSNVDLSNSAPKSQVSNNRQNIRNNSKACNESVGNNSANSAEGYSSANGSQTK